MDLRRWALIICLLVLAQVLKQQGGVLEPWLKQQRSAVSQLSQGQTGQTGGTVTQSQPQREAPPNTQATQAPEPPGESLRWRPTSDDRLGIVLAPNLQIQIVEPLSPAEVAGLNSGDRLLAVNGKSLNSPSELRDVLSQKPKQVVLTIKPFVKEAGQEQQNVTVKLTTEAKTKL